MVGLWGFLCVCMKSCCCVPDGETPVSVHKGVRCILGNEALEFSGRSEVKLNVSFGVGGAVFVLK